MRIILVGFMGCGKSSLGKKLARKMQYDFLDTDEWIETHAGKSIPHIFSEHGEAYFRELEKTALEAIRKSSDFTIISTGGGLPCFNDNMNELLDAGVVVYLKLSASELAKRLLQSKTERPLISTFENEESLRHYINKQLETRSEFYEQAHLIPIGRQQRINEISELISNYISEI